MNQINKNLEEEVISLYEKGLTPTAIKKVISQKTGFKKTKSNELYNEIFNKILCSAASEVAATSDQNYQYNKLTGDYVFYLTKAGRNVVLHESKLQDILNAYSNAFGDERSLEDISRMLSWRKEWVVDLLKILNFSHESLPILPESSKNKEDEDILKDLDIQRKFVIKQKFEKKRWDDTISLAQKYQEFQNNVNIPIQEFLNNWTPKQSHKSKEVKLKGNEQYSFLCSLNDTHIGEKADQKYLFHGQDYNSEIACQNIDNYVENIKSDIKNRNQSFKDAYIVVNGDFLNSAINGETWKGTKLHNDHTNEALFELGLNCLIRFVEKFAEIFPKVSIKVQKGNHDSIILNFLAQAAAKYFKDNKNISFDICKSWCSLFRINNVAVLITHGGSDEYKTAIPKGENKIKNYIQELLLAKSDELVGCKARIAVTGHKHSFLQQDMGSFEFYCFGAPVLGGYFEDNMNFRSTPRQNCLILDNNHVVETLHYYFD